MGVIRSPTKGTIHHKALSNLTNIAKSSFNILKTLPSKSSLSRKPFLISKKHHNHQLSQCQEKPNSQIFPITANHSTFQWLRKIRLLRYINAHIIQMHIKLSLTLSSRNIVKCFDFFNRISDKNFNYALPIGP